MNIFNKSFTLGFIFLTLMLFSLNVMADNSESCSTIFADALGTINSGGEINLNYNAAIFNSPDNIIAANQINTNSGSSILSCHPQNCSTTNTLSALTLPNFENYSSSNKKSINTNGSYIFDGSVTDFEEIDANSNATLTFLTPASGFYKIGKLSLNDKVKLYLYEGDYYIEEFSLNSELEIHILGSGSARVFTQKKVDFNDKSKINSLNGLEGDPSKLIWTFYEGFTINTNSVFTGFIYSKEDVDINSNVNIYGALTAQTITVNTDSSIYYINPESGNADFGDLCALQSTPTIDYFDFSFAASASTCPNIASNIIIQAKDTNGNNLSNYLGFVTLSTSSGHGTWSINDAQGTLNDAINDDGSATYQFTATDNAQITLNLTNAHADILSINVFDNSSGINSNSSTITFSDNVFLVEPDAVQVAGKPLDVTIKLIQTDALNNQCGIASDYNQSDLKLWVEPTSMMSSANTPMLNSINLNTSEPVNSINTVNFAAGIANITLETDDINQFILHIKDDVSGFVKNQDGSNRILEAQSELITLRPFAIYLSLNNDINSATSFADSANGTTFKKVDELFLLTASPVLWQLSDDVNNDGVIDTNALISDNPLIPNIHLSNESIEILVNNNLPLLGETGELDGVIKSNDYINKTLSYLMSYSEVGIIDLIAQFTENGFLETNNPLQNTLLSVGRFVPDHFELTLNNLSINNAQQACAISYQGQGLTFAQDLIFTFSAHNNSGGLVKNYVADFNRFDHSQISPLISRSVGSTAYGSEPEYNPTSPVLTEHLDFDGDWVVTLANNLITFPKLNNQPIASDLPFNASININLTQSQLSDLDGVCVEIADSCIDFSSNDITGATVAYAITTMQNGSSSELSVASLPIEIKIWANSNNRSDFHTITADSCTDFLIDDFEFISCTQTTGNWCSATYSNTLSTPHIWTDVQNGRGNLHIQNPGINNTGQLIVKLNLPDYLKFDFFGNGLTSPTSTIEFGQSSTNSSLIFIQERYK